MNRATVIIDSNEEPTDKLLRERELRERAQLELGRMKQVLADREMRLAAAQDEATALRRELLEARRHLELSRRVADARAAELRQLRGRLA